MPLDPWSYAEKTGTEHSAQVALLMWANMAVNFGLTAANNPKSYTVACFANNVRVAQSKHGGDLIPQLKWLHAIHNQGHGDAIRGAKAKAEGVKAGVADLFLPVPMIYNEHYWNGQLGDEVVETLKLSGLYLELKVGNNKPSDIQLEFMADMRAAGYAADWATGWLEARDKILAYLQISS